MASFDLRSTIDDAIRSLTVFKPGAVETATIRAMNRVLTQGRTAAVREIRSAGYGLRASDVRSGMQLVRARPGNLEAKIVARGRPIPLIRYGARQVKDGVSVNVRNGRKVIQHAFIATMPTGHVGVYIRKDGAKHRKVTRGTRVVWTELPIRELYGPSVPDTLANAAVQDALQRLVEERFPQVLDAQLAYLIG